MKISIVTTGSSNTFSELVNSIEDSVKEIGTVKKIWTLPTPKEKTVETGDLNFFIHGRYAGRYISNNNFDVLINTEQKNVSFKNYNAVLDLFDSPETTYLPLGYSEFFDNRKPLDEDIENLFFGAMNKRRINMSNKFKILNYMGLYGEERDILISRAKFNINLLFNKEWKYTPLRGALFFCKGKMIFQEKTTHYGFHKDFLIDFTEETFFDVMEEWKDYKKRKDYGEFIKEEMMKTPFKEIFLKKLKDIGAI